MLPLHDRTAAARVGHQPWAGEGATDVSREVLLGTAARYAVVTAMMAVRRERERGSPKMVYEAV